MRIPDLDTGNPVTFANSNGVSFGTNVDVITASIATSLTNINLSAGTTSQNLSNFVLSNSNNVSFGLNGSTVTASATVASTQGSINLSAGTTSNLASAFTFSNSNGVSFGLNASTITASIATSLTAINLSAGTTSNNASAFTFSNSNGVSFGLNASTITASIATSLTNINVSAGTTSNNLSQIVFSNSNNVSFGLNGSTITASVTAATRQLSIWENLSGVMFQGSTFNTFSVGPMNPEMFPGLMTANTFLFNINGVSSQSTASGSMLFSFGIYTWNASTLSLLNSVATSLTYAAVSNNSTAFSGFRWLSVHSSQWSAQPVFSQTHYWFGYIVSSSNATQSLALVGQNFANAQGRQGTVGVNQNGTTGSLAWTPFMGGYTATTSQLPTSINQSDLNAAATTVGNFVPHIILDALQASF